MPLLALAGAAILLGFLVIAGVRNLPPDDAVAADDDTLAPDRRETPVPHVLPQKDGTRRSECRDRTGGPAVTAPKALGDRAG